MSEMTKTGSPDFLAVQRDGSQLYQFAKELNRVGDECAEYSRNLERAAGGEETEMSKWFDTKAAQKATGL